MPTPPPIAISWLTLALMNVAAVASIRTLPGMAMYGLGSVLLFLLPALLFFIPAALVTAELGSTWRGGIYGWVHQAFGERTAFVTGWLMWMQAALLLPVILTFGADTLAYLINPALAGNGAFTAGVVVVSIWLITLLALRGVDALARLSSLFMLVGTLLPALLLSALAVHALMGGMPSSTPLHMAAFWPALEGGGVLAGHGKGAAALWQHFEGELASLVLIVSCFLAYSGIEVNAIYARRLADPVAGMRRALILCVLLTLLIFIPPTLAIAAAVPAHEISLTVGVMQAFAAVLTGPLASWLKPVGLMLIVGVFGSMLTWVAGSAKLLQFAGRAGLLPPWWQRANRARMPANVMCLQALIVSLISLVYVLIPDVSAAFWLLSALAAQLYLIVYLLMFASALHLRRSQPSVTRGYRLDRLPLVAGTGAAASLFALLLGFIPPSSEHFPLSALSYAALLCGMLVLAALPPFVFYARKQPAWRLAPPETAAADYAPLEQDAR